MFAISRALRRAAVLASVGFAVAIGLASANEPTRPPSDRSESPSGGRYVMNPVDGGVLRMDTDTGIVSLCGRKSGTWACEVVSDDYKTLQKDSDRLARENADLRRELAELRREAGKRPSGNPGTGRRLELPSEEEVDKALGQLERYFKKFKDLIERHSSGETPGRT